MRRSLLPVALVIAFLCAATQPLAAKTTLTVTVKDKDGDAVSGASVRVVPAFPVVKEGVKDNAAERKSAADGTAEVEKYDNGMALEADVLAVVVFVPKGYAPYGDEGTNVYGARSKAVVIKYVHVKPGKDAAVEIDIHEWRPAFFNDEELTDRADMAKKAAEKCDKATYDRYTGVLKDYIAGIEQEAASLEKALDAWADEQKLPRANLADARKALKAGQAVQAGLRDQALIERLKTYVERLESLEAKRKEADKVRKILKGIPAFKECPKDAKSQGMLQGACPQGKSGGLLAGALNEAFDTDIEGQCEDPAVVTARRDKDREERRD
jgi:hypothetical protein